MTLFGLRLSPRRGPTPQLLRMPDRWRGVTARTLSAAAAVRVTAAYAAVLLAVSVILTKLGPHTRDLVVDQMSTNLHNLARGHFDTLVGSAFIDAGGRVYLWLPGLACLLALGELIWRGRGLLVTFAVGHIGATLIVALGLVAAIEVGWLEVSVARATDVGMSYGAVCVLGALSSSIPARWRPVWIGGWLGIALAATWAGDFTAFGHVLALLLGFALSLRMRASVRWTPVHLVLLTVSVTFGYLVLSGSSPTALVAAAVGALVGLLYARVLRSGDIAVPISG